MKKYVIDNSSGKGSMVRVILLTMKLLTILIFAGNMAMSANVYSQKTKIDLQLQNSTVATILKSIESRSEFIFFYDIDLINTRVEKSISVKDANIGTVLEELFGSSNIAYFVDDRQIFLYKKDDINQLENLKEKNRAEVEQPKKKVLSGKVSDSKGLSVPGLTVVVKGTTFGTITDNEGTFRLSVPIDAKTLVFSFVGMKMQEIPVENKTNFSVIMEEETVGLEEVVVAVGYGTQKKESVVGAISVATGEIIKKGVQGADLGVALQGALPGLAVMRTNGRPGGGNLLGLAGSSDDQYAYMYIRGQKTWNNAAPLVLVDGVERPLQNINPQEIEKISLLKDASSTAVFGVKGANGVILITTLRGKEGKAKLSFDATYSAKTLSKFLQLEDSYSTNLMKNYAILNEVPIREASWGSIVPNRYLQLWKNHTYPYYLPDVNWQDAVSKKWANDMNMSVNLSGGTKFVKYFGSLSSLHEDDMFDLKDAGYGYKPSFDFDRLNFRSNLDFDFTPTTRFSVNLSGFYAAQKSPNKTGAPDMSAMYSQPPDIFPIRYPDGTWGFDSSVSSFFYNPIYDYETSGYKVDKQTSLNTDFKLTQKLDFVTQGLSFSVKASYDNSFNTSGPAIYWVLGDNTKFISQSIVNEMYPGISASEIARLEKKYTTWNITSPGGGANNGFDFVLPPYTYTNETQTSASTYRNLYYELALNYARDFGKHSFSGLALVSRQEQARGSEFTNYREDWVGRLTYGYDRRYNIELNAAYNGSEKFSSKYRFGFFPSFGAGWTVSNEAFFKSLKPIVSNLRFRYSQGTIGSDAGIDRWQYVQSWVAKQSTTSATSTDLFRFGTPYLQNAYPFRYEGVIPNPDIQWETAKKSDFGIETGFFNDQIRMTFDYFNEKRTNIFMSGSQITSRGYTGFTPVATNKGRVDAHGWEFELQLNKTLTNGLHLWLTHSWTYAKDKVIDRADPALLPDYQKLAGKSIDQPKYSINQSVHPILTWDGIYNTAIGTSTTNILPGNYALVDYDSNGIIDSNDAAPYGYPNRPQFTYAPSFGFDYKNFSFNMRWYGVYNVAGSLGIYRPNFMNQFSIAYPQYKDMAWSPELGMTTDATYPGIRFGSTSTSGYFDKSRAYLRLQHVELAYSLGSTLMKRLGVSNLKLVISGDNLYLRSKMLEDLDAPQSLYNGQLMGAYPTTRRVNFGLSFNFQ